MEYRESVAHDRLDAPNEARADDAERALAVATDRNGEADTSDVFLDASDLVAHLVHFCKRAGLDFAAVVAKGEQAAEGDLEDGPEAAHDHARFPGDDDE